MGVGCRWRNCRVGKIAAVESAPDAAGSDHENSSRFAARSESDRSFSRGVRYRGRSRGIAETHTVRLAEGEDRRGQRSRLGNGGVFARARWHCGKRRHGFIRHRSQWPANRKSWWVGTYFGRRRWRLFRFHSRLALDSARIRFAQRRARVRRNCFARARFK